MSGSYLDLIPAYCSISHSEPTLNLEDVKHLPKLAQQKFVLRHVNPVPCDMVASRSDVFSLRALVYSSLTIQQSSLKGSFNKGHFDAFYVFSTCFLHVFQASRMCFEVLAAPMLEFPVMIQSLAQLWQLPVWRSHGLDPLRVLDCWTPNDRSRSGSWGMHFMALLWHKKSIWWRRIFRDGNQ